MLKLRICQKCGTESRSSAAYFCHNCGERLPGSILRVREERARDGPKKRPSLKRINFAHHFTKPVLVFLLTASVALGSFVIFQGNRGADSGGEIYSSQKNQLVRDDLRFEIEEFFLGEEEIFGIVPHDVDFYFESRNPEIVLGYILDQREIDILEETVSLTLKEATSFLNETFVLIEDESEFSFIARVTAYDFVKNKISEVTLPASWQVEILGDFLIVSNSDRLRSEIEKAFKKQILSLGLSSEFLKTKKALPERGQIFIYLPARTDKEAGSLIERERLKLIPDSLQGVGFVGRRDSQGTKIIGVENGY